MVGGGERPPKLSGTEGSAGEQVMVANIRCAELLEEQLRALASDRAWTALADAAAAGVVPEFGARSAALLESCITGAQRRMCHTLLANPRVCLGSLVHMALG